MMSLITLYERAQSDARFTSRTFPEGTAADYGSALIKATIAGIPFVGGTAAELFGIATAPILGRRRDEWFEKLRVLINDSGEVTIESLMENEKFVSALLQAFQSALRN